MAFLSLLVCSLLVALSYSQPWSPNSGGGYGGVPGGDGGYGGGSPGGNGGYGGGSPGGNGGYGGGDSGGNSGYGGNGGHSGGNTGGGSRPATCACNLNCIDSKANGNKARCQSGYTAVSCSCGKGCGSYNFVGSNTCVCQCDKMDWTSARCCKNF